MKLFTIGFTKKTAEGFFATLRDAGTCRVVDVRLNNVSQLAGFAKRLDLEYFLRELCNMDYVHLPELAPTQEMLDRYKKHKGGWEQYEREFLALMNKRRIERTVPEDVLADGCLLCSEDMPHHCHRRLVAEYLKTKYLKAKRDDVEIIHLV